MSFFQRGFRYVREMLNDVAILARRNPEKARIELDRIWESYSEYLVGTNEDIFLNINEFLAD